MEFVDHCEITQVHQGAVDQVRQVLPPDEVLSDLADLAEEGDRRAVAEETAVPACCAFLEGAVPPSNRVPSRPAVSRWTRW